MKIKFSPQSQRKQLANTLDYLLTVFDGNAEAMYEAIADYRAKNPPAAVEKATAS